MARLVRFAASTALLVLATALMCFSTASAAGGAFPRWHQLNSLRYDFARYVKDANRRHVPGTPEYARREAIFNERLASIKRHNADPAQTYKRGINQFADWTEEEWKAYNRARPDLGRPSTLPSTLYEPASNSGTLPKFVDYRMRVNPPILTGIKNQGSCGSCWAHAAVEEMESFFALRYGQLPVLSTQQVSSCTDTEQGCGGGSFVAAWEAVQKYGGLNEEWTYPYVDFFAPAMEKQYTQKCQNITTRFPVIQNPDGTNFTFTWWPKANVSSFVRVPRNDAPAVMSALATQGPLAITVASDQWSDYESGILQNNYTNAQTNWEWQSLNHDVQLVGYGYDFDVNLAYWIVRNSWGTNYGEEGFIRLLRPAVEPCGNITGQEVCGTSGLLVNPGYVEVKPLDNQNGYYF